MRIHSEINRGSRKEASAGRANTFAKGYSFLEVLISTAILGIVGTSLYSAFAFGFSVVQSTRLDLRATQILTQKIEGIRLLTWTQLQNTNSYLTPTFTDSYDPLGGNCSGTVFRGSVSSKVPASGEVPEAYRANMRTVTVSLYWTNYSGGKPIPQMRQMQTRVARNGMQNYIWGAQ